MLEDDVTAATNEISDTVLGFCIISDVTYKEEVVELLEDYLRSSWLNNSSRSGRSLG